MPRWMGHAELPGESKPGCAPWEEQAHVPCGGINSARALAAVPGLGMHAAGLQELASGHM